LNTKTLRRTLLAMRSSFRLDAIAESKKIWISFLLSQAFTVTIAAPMVSHSFQKSWRQMVLLNRHMDVDLMGTIDDNFNSHFTMETFLHVSCSNKKCPVFAGDDVPLRNAIFISRLS